MLKMSRIALVAALFGSSTLAFAAGTEQATINVTATVNGVCKLTSTATVPLAVVADPSTGGVASNIAQVRFKCTKSLPYTFSVSQGTLTSSTGTLTGAKVSDGATTPVEIPLTATWTQPSGTGLGFSAANQVNADVTVKITQADYIDAPAGSYTGSLTVKIDY